jgi:hypothetical protein
LVSRSFRFVQVVYDADFTTTGEGGAAKPNPRAAEYQAVVLQLFQLFAARLVRLVRHASKDGDEANVLESVAEAEDEHPLRMEDSLQALQLLGRGVARTADAAKQADAVLRHMLERLDHELRATELVAEELLRAGLDVPLWIRDRYTKFMREDADDEEENLFAALDVLDARARPPSTHAPTLRSFPFLSFLRYSWTTVSSSCCTT